MRFPNEARVAQPLLGVDELALEECDQPVIRSSFEASKTGT